MASPSVLNCPFYLLHLLQLRLGGMLNVAERPLGLFLLLPSGLLAVESEDVQACESGELLADWLVDIGLIILLLITSRILPVSLFAKPQSAPWSSMDFNEIFDVLIHHLPALKT